MKILIVENDAMAVKNLLSAMKEKRWTCNVFMPQGDPPASKEELRRFLLEVCGQRPDIVVLDAGLSIEEQTLLDELDFKGDRVSADSVSGFKYCRAITDERLGIPVVLLTKYGHGQVARTAMRVGADRVLIKRTKAGELIHEIEELVKSSTAHDCEFYWHLRENLASRLDSWQGEAMQQAMDRFFLNESSVRRFGLFTASLRGILSHLFQGEPAGEKDLMLSLVKSQVLLSLVDPRLRDHVKHTGNVFWVGYRLLHEIDEFVNPLLLPGCVPALYDQSGPLSPREQLFNAWTLAALFHDYGYVDEKQDKLKGLISSMLPGATITFNDIRSEQSFHSNMRLLRAFVDRMVGADHFLHHYIDTVFTSYGSAMEQQDVKQPKTAFQDHGVLSAHRLLNMVPLDKLDPQMKNIVMHAALAIAYHNYSEMLHKWKLTPQCNGHLLMGEFPICSLLAFCDNVQTWDREMEADPALHRAEEQKGLLERLVLSDTAYVSGSEISEFSTCRRADATGYDIRLRLKYFVELGGDVAKVCENLGLDIEGWIQSNRLRKICDTTGLSPLIHGQIIYELPMLAGTRKAPF